MAKPLAFPGDDVFLISIALDADLGEYYAIFMNQNYGAHLSAPTVSRLKHRTVRLLRNYLGVNDDKVVFCNAAAPPQELADAIPREWKMI